MVMPDTWIKINLEEKRDWTQNTQYTEYSNTTKAHVSIWLPIQESAQNIANL